MNIYEFVLSQCHLTDEHRNELKVKRGFSDQTITDLKFVSGGDYLIAIESQLIEKYVKEDLINSGVCVENNDKISISPILLKPNIIIPYLNKENKCYLLRPHKLGLKGVEIQIYHDRFFTDKNLIITEGEFKAAAGFQLGFSTIAVPGISSFSDTHFPKLVKSLNENGVKNICIIFDNEVKDDPAFPHRFKAEPMNRHDTSFYAYYMAKILEKEGFDCRVGTLPDGWRIDGKADIDGALAQGKTKEDFMNVIKESKTHRRFMEDLSTEAQNIINRKLAQKYFKSHVRREFNKYVATRHRGRYDIDEIVSNFIVEIVATHDTHEGILRELRFINEFNERSSSFVITGEQMFSNDTFRTFCGSKGNFVWSGRNEDLDVIWKSEFLRDSGLRIYEPDHIGRMEGDDTWIFQNTAFHKDKEYRPDDSRIFWIDKKGIKPVSLGVSAGKNVVAEGLPYLNTHPFDLGLFKQRLEASIGAREARLCIGWCASVLFLEEIFAAYGCFPFLFLTGKRASGKSTIGDWLMNLFGLENCGKMASDTTTVAIQRYMAYYSSLPLYIDEYRNTKNITYKNGMLRNAYNRQSAGKGIKSDFGVREAKIRGTLLLCGEETPEDNALLSRCIVIMISAKKRIQNNFTWFMDNRVKFSYFTYNIIKNKKAMLPGFLEDMADAKAHLTAQGFDDRVAINYAVVGAGYSALYNDDPDIVKDVVMEARRSMVTNDEEQIVKVFLSDLLYLKTIGKIDKRFWLIDGDKIYLYFNGLHSAWAEHYKKTRAMEAFKESTVREYMKEEPGYLGCSVLKSMSVGMRRCLEFDSNLASEDIATLVSLPAQHHANLYATSDSD